MEANIRQEALWLQSLSAAERARFLAALGHNLSVATRALCHSGAEAKEALEWVRVPNEVSHRVTSYLSHHHAGDEDPGWVPVVVEYVLGSQVPIVHQYAQQAWSHAKQMPSNASAA